MLRQFHILPLLYSLMPYYKSLSLFAINKLFSHKFVLVPVVAAWCSSCLYFSIPLKGMAAVGRAADEADGVQVVSRLPEQEPDEDFEVEPSWISEQGASETSPLFPPSRGQSPKLRAPKDPYRIVWLVFYMLGMTTLLPWNFFISVNDYWNFKFRDTEQNSTHTKLQKEFTSYLAIASNVPNATFVILNVLYGQRFNLNLRLVLMPPHECTCFTRLIAALSVMATLFVGVLIMTRIDSDGWQEWFLISTLLMVVFLNICTAIYQGGLIGWSP